MQIMHGLEPTAMLRPSQIINGLEERAKALRLSRKELAALADLDENTIRRTFEGETDPLIGTLDKLETAIAGQEAKVKRHLDDVMRSQGGRQLDMLSAGAGK